MNLRALFGLGRGMRSSLGAAPGEQKDVKPSKDSAAVFSGELVGCCTFIYIDGNQTSTNGLSANVVVFPGDARYKNNNRHAEMG